MAEEYFLKHPERHTLPHSPAFILLPTSSPTMNPSPLYLGSLFGTHA